MTIVFKSLYEAFAKGDVPTVLAAMDPGIEWNEAEHVTFWPGHSFIGPEAVVEGVFARRAATFGDTYRIEINRLLDSGSVVLMEGRDKGIVQATGKALTHRSLMCGTYVGPGPASERHTRTGRILQPVKPVTVSALAELDTGWPPAVAADPASKVRDRPRRDLGVVQVGMIAAAGTDDLIIVGVAALEMALLDADRPAAQDRLAAVAGLTGERGCHDGLRTVMNHGITAIMRTPYRHCDRTDSRSGISHGVRVARTAH